MFNLSTFLFVRFLEYTHSVVEDGLFKRLTYH
jgi:hypothetical protein